MKQNIFKLIADLRFAIFILLVIASLSIIGTVIEQDQSVETYKLNYPLTNRVFGFLSWDIILRFGLDHIYKTWWFISSYFIIWTKFINLYFITTIPIFKELRVDVNFFEQLSNFVD